MNLSDIISLGNKTTDIYVEGCDNCKRNTVFKFEGDNLIIKNINGHVITSEEYRELSKPCKKCLRYYGSDLRDRHERVRI